MNFLIDAQLPPGLIRWLVDKGHTAQHVYDLGFAGAEDSLIWNHVLGIDAIVITKDEDFAERVARVSSGPVIVCFELAIRQIGRFFDGLSKFAD